MRQRRYAEMSRSDLLREIHAVQAALGVEGPLQQSQLVEAQQALEESRGRYADLFDFVPVGYLTMDSAGVIAEINLAAAALLGTERSKLIGDPMLGSVAEADHDLFLDHLRRCRDSQRTVETRLHLMNRAGMFPANLVSRRAHVGVNESLWHTALVDLTERERVESERRGAEEERLRLLRQEQSLRAEAEAKDRFLAMLSHELRTPLTPIVFTLGLLDARGNLPEDVRDAMDVVRRNVQIEAKLIDDLLDTSRIASGKLHLQVETVDLHRVMEEVLGMTAAQIDASRIVVDFGTRARSHHVRGDSTRLHQVLWNVVTNAIQHTPSGGRITIRSINEKPGRVKVSVEDEGSGIEPSLIDRLFHPFSQGAREGAQAGLGLGLAISRGIIEAHGGTIAVFSEGTGQGARFEIELGTVAPAEPLPEPEMAPRREGVTPRILLVEDHVDTATALGELLGLHGFAVTVATSFGEAVSHRDEAFDVLVTDIGLPDGDGIQLLRHLAPEGGLPAVALSGFGASSDVERSSEAGFRGHLTKPVAIEDLIRAIARVTSHVRSA